MIDIVYILGNGSKWNDNELKYSVRSVLKYAKNFGNIWIVGEKPRCDLDAPTRFVPLTPKANHKTTNIRHALKEVAEIKDCTEKFIYMNDDFFFTQEVDVETLPNYYCGTLGCRAAHYLKDSPSYWRTLCYTWAVLSALGYPTRDYEVHGPILMEKAKLLSALSLVGTDAQSQIRSIYANLHGGAVKFLNDSKLCMRKDVDFTVEKFNKSIENRPFFSIGDELSEEIKANFEKLYPYNGTLFSPITYQPAIDKANEEFIYTI